MSPRMVSTCELSVRFGEDDIDDALVRLGVVFRDEGGDRRDWDPTSQSVNSQVRGSHIRWILTRVLGYHRNLSHSTNNDIGVWTTSASGYSLCMNVPVRIKLVILSKLGAYHTKTYVYLCWTYGRDPSSRLVGGCPVTANMINNTKERIIRYLLTISVSLSIRTIFCKSSS